MRALLLVAFLFCSLFSAESTKKVLFNCKSGDSRIFLKMLDSMSHLASYYEKNHFSYDMVVVAQSECVKFMLSDTKDTEYTAEDIPLDVDLELSKLQGKARFEQCDVTLERKHIPHSKLRKNIKVIPSATVSVVDYQLGGYALVP